MKPALIALYLLAAGAATYGLGLQAFIAHRTRLLYRQTPLIYSRLRIPEDVDLRDVLEHPRVFFFTLTVAGVSLRILLALILFLSVEFSGIRAGWGVAGVLLALLVGAELVGRQAGREEGELGAFPARVMRALGALARGMSRAPDQEVRSESDDANRDILMTVDGNPVFDPGVERTLAGLLSLKRRTVREAMIPRAEMMTVNQDWSVGRTAAALRDVPYARVPVSGRSRDDVVGLVHTKDLLLMLHSGQEGAFVRGLMREVAYVPANRPLDRLLRDFQTRRRHVAVVQNEYGQTIGLITMDDILRAALGPEDS